MKGISAVIATLLLLVITIGLAMTVYFYVNNMTSRQTEKVIDVQPYCSNNQITLVITNLGTQPIVDNVDLKYILNNRNPTPIDFTGTQDGNLNPRDTKTVNIAAQPGANSLLLIYPSGSTRLSVFC